jgi:hypothetical protein
LKPVGIRDGPISVQPRDRVSQNCASLFGVNPSYLE